MTRYRVARPDHVLMEKIDEYESRKQKGKTIRRKTRHHATSSQVLQAKHSTEQLRNIEASMEVIKAI